MRKTIVVSAVNLRKGGTLTILRQCLEHLGTRTGEWRVVALVHDKRLALFPGIEYIELPWTVKSWGRRLWCEYVTMGRIARQIGDVDLWLSLHDTTPRVGARRQAVYCQTSFPFLKPCWRDLRFDGKIVLFALFTRLAYRLFVHRNSHIIVQAEWLRDGLSRMLGVDAGKFVVARPQTDTHASGNPLAPRPVRFIYPATPDAHKNHETLCEAARLLEREVGRGVFSVTLTVDGTENRYARWLRRRWGDVDSIDFAGLLPRDRLFEAYGASHALVFPSRIETWGLPISEFAGTGRPMLLADLPYAHETARGAARATFFPVRDAAALARLMRQVTDGNLTAFGRQPEATAGICGWDELFDRLTRESTHTPS